jgi:hypothetical protein
MMNDEQQGYFHNKMCDQCYNREPFTYQCGKGRKLPSVDCQDFKVMQNGVVLSCGLFGIGIGYLLKALLT